MVLIILASIEMNKKLETIRYLPYECNKMLFGMVMFPQAECEYYLKDFKSSGL